MTNHCLKSFLTGFGRLWLADGDTSGADGAVLDALTGGEEEATISALAVLEDGAPSAVAGEEEVDTTGVLDAVAVEGVAGEIEVDTGGTVFVFGGGVLEAAAGEEDVDPPDGLAVLEETTARKDDTQAAFEGLESDILRLGVYSRRCSRGCKVFKYCFGKRKRS